MSLCQIEEINKGGAYSRTCPTCGLGGKCVKGLPHPYAKPKPNNPTSGHLVDFSKIKVGDKVRLAGEFEVDRVASDMVGVMVRGSRMYFGPDHAQAGSGGVVAHLPASRPIEVGCRVMGGQLKYSPYTVRVIQDDFAWIECVGVHKVVKLDCLVRLVEEAS